MTALRDAIQSYVVAAGAGDRVTDWPRLPRRLRNQHRAVLRAIEDRDPETAARRVGAHISGFYRDTSDSWR